MKMLRSFKRIRLAPGEEKTAATDIPPEDLEFYDPENKQWKRDQAYRIYAGNSSLNALGNACDIQFP